MTESCRDHFNFIFNLKTIVYTNSHLYLDNEHIKNTACVLNAP